MEKMLLAPGLWAGGRGLPRRAGHVMWPSAPFAGPADGVFAPRWRALLARCRPHGGVGRSCLTADSSSAVAHSHEMRQIWRTAVRRGQYQSSVPPSIPRPLRWYGPACTLGVRGREVALPRRRRSRYQLTDSFLWPCVAPPAGACSAVVCPVRPDMPGESSSQHAVSRVGFPACLGRAPSWPSLPAGMTCRSAMRPHGCGSERRPRAGDRSRRERRFGACVRARIADLPRVFQAHFRGVPPWSGPVQ